MDLMSGLDKFGLNPEEINDLYDGEKKTVTVNTPVAAAVQTEDERDFVFAKSVTCPVCDDNFQTLTVKASKVRLVGSDDVFLCILGLKEFNVFSIFLLSVLEYGVIMGSIPISDF